MKSKFEQREKAIELRKQGFSYKEILAKVPVSKASLSGWFKNFPLLPEEKAQLDQRVKVNLQKGRESAAVSNRWHRIERENIERVEAKKIYNENKGDSSFILGIGLYWAEGSKKTSSFQFMNSDPQMIRFMIYWVQKYLKVGKEGIALRIHTHAGFEAEKYEDYWSKAVKLPMEQFSKTVYKHNAHGVSKKDPKYKGCARLEVKGGMSLLRRMLYLKESLENELIMLYSSDLRP